VKWLGKVPELWNKSRLRWLSRIFSGGTPDKTNQDYWTNGTIPWLNSGAVNQCTITEPSDFISQEAYENSSTKWINPGSLVIALAGQGKTKGMVAQLAIEATCNQSMAAIVPENEITPRFLFWWLTSNYQNIRNLSGGDLRDGLNLELIGDIQCPLPESKEQTIIASFLDRETSRIDTLISEKERLISLLQEYRQALISHTVTKGLDPKVKMKDSGVEWLGEIPEHWRVMPFFTHAQERKEPNKGMLENNLLSLSYGRIVPKDINTDEGLLPESFESYQIVHPDDIVFRLTDLQNDKRSLRSAICKELGIITSAYLVVRTQDLDSNYLNYLMRSYDVIKVFYSMGGGMRQSMKFDDIKRLPLIVPTTLEQSAIGAFLDQETSHIDALISEARKFIDLLKEYRSSLITAAVIGKIDVGEVVSSGSEKREIAHE
jgi:type I restriction enzyme S subunit